MRFWWVSASEQSEGGWHWSYFFSNPRCGRRWGGPEWIRSSISHTHIRRMRKGDIVVAYQAQEGVTGLAVLASDGYQSFTGGKYDIFDLASRPVLALKLPIPLKAVKGLPHAAQTFQFVQVLRGTVFQVKPVGFMRLVGLILAYDFDQSRELSSFISRAAVSVPYRLVPRRTRAA